jgi:hypothetical protein
MWEGYCGDVIRRVNRNLLIAILCIAALGGLLTYSQRRYLSQFFRGPTAVDTSVVAQHPVEDQFVRVHVARAFDTGLQHVTTQDGSTQVDSQYFVTSAGEKLLILRVPDGGHPEEIRDLTLEGRVRPLSAELTQSLESRRPPHLPPLATYYIDGQDFRGLGIAFLIIGIPVLLFWLWMLARYRRGSADFAEHSFAKRIAKYGQLEMMVHEIDAETVPMHPVYSLRSIRVEITENWLLARMPFGANAIRLNHLAWAHLFVLKRKLYFLVTVGKNHFLNAYDDMGKKMQVKLSQKMVEGVIGDLVARCPHAIFGYQASIEKLWKRTRKEPGRFLEEAQSMRGQAEPSAARTSSIPLQ